MELNFDQFNQSVYQSWCDVLGLPDCDPDADFFDLGGTSLQAVELFDRLEKEFKANFPTTILLEYPTSEQLSTELYKILTADQPFEDCLSLLQRNAGEKKLFLFHPIGGFSAVYVPLARSLKFSGSVYGVNVPKMDADECKKLSVEVLAARYANAIQKIQLEGDFLFAGYSAGGVFAFATASAMQSKGGSIKYLGLIDTQFTVRHYQSQVSLWRRLLAHGKFLRRRGLGKGVRDIVTNQRLQKKRQVLHKRRMKIANLDQQRKQLISSVIEKQDFSQWYPSIQAILQVLIKYYEPSPLAADKARVVLYETANYLRNMRGNIGWARLIDGQITSKHADGDHLSLLKEPNYRELAKTMANDLSAE